MNKALLEETLSCWKFLATLTSLNELLLDLQYRPAVIFTLPPDTDPALDPGFIICPPTKPVVDVDPDDPVGPPPEEFALLVMALFEHDAPP